MAKCGVTNIGGGGIGSDEVSATKDTVLSGKTYVGADTNDEIGTGTMANNGANGNQSLNAGNSFLVKKGFHAQNFSVGANSLASQTPGNAGPGAILTGYNAWVNGNKVLGSIPIQGADEAADRSWATNWSTWGGGEIFLGVRNGHYLNGVNWIRYNLANFVAGNIKKGVNIGGIVGTFEGYVPTSTDLYLRGNNIKSWYALSNSKGLPTATFDAGQITPQYNTCQIKADNINLTGYRYLNIEGYANNGSGIIKEIRLWRVMSAGVGDALLGYLNVTNYPAGNYVYGFDISTSQVAGNIYLSFSQMIGAIYRIWLS